MLERESLCDSPRGALYRRAPLLKKRFTESFFQFTLSELLKSGSFALLLTFAGKLATRDAASGLRKPLKKAALMPGIS